MIIKELQTASIRIQDGALGAMVPVVTDRGVIGMQVTFNLADHPELDALVPMIDAEIRKVLAKTVGLMQTPGSKIKN